MGGEVGRRLRPTSFVQISGRGGKHARPRADVAHRCAGIHQRSEPQRDIDAFGHQILPVIDKQQLDVQSRMPIKENRQARNDLAHGKARAETDAQPAAELARAPRRLFRLFELRQKRFDTREKVSTGVG